MSTKVEIEKRLAALELKVAELSQRDTPRRKVRKNWLTSMIGCMDGFPEFAEVVRLGKEWRESHHPDDDDLLSPTAIKGKASKQEIKKSKKAQQRQSRH